MNRTRPIIAIYPGSFDPITLGHEDIANRALEVADRLIVGVAYTSTHEKRGMFDVEERVAMIEDVLGGNDRVEVRSFRGLLVDFAEEQGASLIVRGLRAVSDFEYELQMAQVNSELRPGVQTIFLVPEVRRSFISSSFVREVATLGGDVSNFVSPAVLGRLHDKVGRG